MKINERIRQIAINDHETERFEGLWDLPYGVGYNSYLVVDEKVALIDTAGSAYTDMFFSWITEEIGDRNVDYVVINHMEPDHSSLIAELRRRYPEVVIVTNAKAVPMIEGYHGITDNIQVVKENDTLSLGGCSLKFIMTPMVHWPETMMTWLEEEKTLFSMDAFGSFMATDGDTLDNYDKFEMEMIRYYACIVGKYGLTVQNALKKAATLPIERICSTHGSVWEKRIPEVIALYQKLSTYSSEKGVCIAYGSMYGNTAKAAQSLAEELGKRGIPYEIHDLSKENVSYAYRDAFRFSHIVVGCPTYNNDIYPPVLTFMHGLVSRQLKNRKFFAVGSYTWAGGSVKMLNAIATDQKWELIGDGIGFKQGYTPEKCDMKAVAALIEEDMKNAE